MATDLKGKKLLILGANPETANLVRVAQEMGVTTIVTDYDSNAPAKKPGSLDPSQITNGMKVRHDRFGLGVVLKVEPVAGDALITVDFDGMRKNMLAGTAGLKKGD